MTNLTINVDSEVLKRARIRALEESTSVNAVLREHLMAYAGMQRTPELSIADLLELSRRTRAARGGQRWTRDDLHER